MNLNTKQGLSNFEARWYNLALKIFSPYVRKNQLARFCSVTAYFAGQGNKTESNTRTQYMYV